MGRTSVLLGASREEAPEERPAVGTFQYRPPRTTPLDPQTGKTSTFNLPRFEDPNAIRAWKPLFDLLHEDMAKRGIENTIKWLAVSLPPVPAVCFPVSDRTSG